MPCADFIHLRVHSAYSLSEGAIKADKIPALAREANMPAVAITDTANLFGALEFSQACAGKGIQPIIGCQVALARSDNARLPPDLVVLLAQSTAGLNNLQQLSSRGFLDTDPGLKANNLVALEDDKTLFAAENVIPLIKSAKQTQAITNALNDVSAKLTTDDLIDMNAEAAKGTNLSDIAKKWLAKAGLGS